MKIVKLPTTDLTDIAAGLRNLATQIENGDFNDAHNLAWVIDCGDGVVEVGLLGQSPSPGPLAHYLYCLGQRRLENV